MLLSRSWLLLGATLLASSVAAQRTTYEDASGNTIVASVVTDADGDPISTRTLLRVTATAAGAAPADTTVGDQGQNFDYSTCTTEGCPVAPTTYTQVTTINGQESSMLYTWTATTPVTPTPQTFSTGSVMKASDYISTYASGVSAPAGARISQRSSSATSLLDRNWVAAGAMAVVAGLVGAAIVL